MKAAFLFLSSVFASFAAAQGTDRLPPCAQSCADGFLKDGIGNCGTEVKCICENKNFLGDIACCLEGKCNDLDKSSAVAYASRICVAFAVTDLPSVVSCTATPTATGTGTSSNTAAPTTGGPAPTATPNAATTTTPSGNYGPRQTAQAGLGAIGGIIAAAVML
ncbi:hypothetical protein V8F20_002420 [Naviculisporaceae sp. PSN 640]